MLRMKPLGAPNAANADVRKGQSDVSAMPVFSGQPLHTPCPASGWYWLTPHTAHSVAPAVAYLPGAQVWSHVVFLATSLENLPASQSVHSKIEVRPSRVENVPGGQVPSQAALEVWASSGE